MEPRRTDSESIDRRWMRCATGSWLIEAIHGLRSLSGKISLGSFPPPRWSKTISICTVTLRRVTLAREVKIFARLFGVNSIQSAGEHAD